MFLAHRPKIQDRRKMDEKTQPLPGIESRDLTLSVEIRVVLTFLPVRSGRRVVLRVLVA